MFRRTMAILLLVTVGLVACGPKDELDIVQLENTFTPEAVAEPAPTGTNTPIPETGGGEEPTPAPTATAIEYPDPVWDVTSGWPYGLPRMAHPIESTFDGKAKVYIMLGSDAMPHRSFDLTDAIVAVFVIEEKDAISIVSIPRDLYVYLPGWGMGRINKAWEIGGYDLVDKVFTYNFGIKPSGIVYGRMSAFTRFVDVALGGVTVDVTASIYEKCGDTRVNMLPGVYEMSGQTALCFVRGRSASSDYDRMGRQQDMLRGLFSGFMEAAGDDPIKLGESLYETYKDAGVKTDIVIFDLPDIIWSVINSTEEIYYYRMIPPVVEHIDHPESGAWLLIPPLTYDMEMLIDLAIGGFPWDMQ